MMAASRFVLGGKGIGMQAPAMAAVEAVDVFTLA
jgi:hypothetical protein|tara:strand:- start:207 stop:308 length:102 start_codon:yes stop_codon:yes gene_type:complete